MRNDFPGSGILKGVLVKVAEEATVDSRMMGHLHNANELRRQRRGLRWFSDERRDLNQQIRDEDRRTRTDAWLLGLLFLART